MRRLASIPVRWRATAGGGGKGAGTSAGVIWADEPTGNLDTEVTQVIVELLIRMNKQGQTIVLVIHNPQVAERAARILRMRDGRFEQPSQADRTALRAAER
jgi:ABC-type lipoprotein export system ATPase subunit